MAKLNGEEIIERVPSYVRTRYEKYVPLTYEEAQSFLGINCSEMLKPTPTPDFSIEVQCPYEEPYEDGECKETMLNHFTTLIHFDRLFTRGWILEQQPYLLCRYFPESETLRTGEINAELDPKLQKPFTPMTYEVLQVYLGLNCNQILREGMP